MLVLAGAHQQVDPANRRTRDANDDITRSQRRWIRWLHRLQRSELLDRLQWLLAELRDDDPLSCHRVIMPPTLRFI
jgi:hypothetical protein